MKSPSPPPAPDPVATARAQGASNIGTAAATQTINMVDQYTPDGSLVYEQIGSAGVPDGFGGTSNVPRYKATQTLSEQQQALKGVNDATDMNLATIGRDQSAKIGGMLSEPVNLNNEATESRLMDLGRKRLDPMWDRRQQDFETEMVNRGIRPGSAAYSGARGDLEQGRNDAYNSLLLGGRAQAVQEALAERNQPINEITALMSGSQVSQPNFVNTPNAQVAGVDYTGLVRDNYNAQMQQWQSKVNSNNAMMGGLFGLAGSAATAGIKYSDRRLKSNIARIGTHPIGIGLYEYDIAGRRERGVMADEVASAMPGALTRDVRGFAMVDYDMIGGV